MAEVMSGRALNRATLARQMLLERAECPPEEVIKRLIGMQAQEARPPYIGLWTRQPDFCAQQLTEPLHAREVVRVTAMRGTLHVMTADDYVAFRTTLQPMLTAGLRAILKEQMDAFDPAVLVEQAREQFAKGPATFGEVRDHLAGVNPGADVRAMGYVVRMILPLVQVPEDAPWGFPANAAFFPAEDWLTSTISLKEQKEELVLRYLAAFGPATVADAQAWSGLNNLKPVFEQLRPELVTFRDERKRELFDLPDATRPDEEAPAPVRFLPDFDNMLLAHADRSRVMTDEQRKRMSTGNLRVPGSLLVDGFVAGMWKASQKSKSATLKLTHFRPLSKSELVEVEEEAFALLKFIFPGSANQTIEMQG